MRAVNLLLGWCIATGCGRLSFDVASMDADGGSCGDETQTEAETDIDCGGPDCGKCADGNACLIPSDCASGRCSALVCDGWAAPDFAYRRLVTVDRAGGMADLVDYPVVVTLDTATLITAGKLQASCADLRFTPIDAPAFVPHWIESGCNSAATKVWVKVSAISASGAELWAYYGQPTASAAANGLAVFPAFDDFETGDLSRWMVGVVGAVPTQASSVVQHGGSYSWAKGPSVCVSNCFSNYTVTLTWSSPLSLPAGTWRAEYWRREPRDWGAVFFTTNAVMGDAGPTSNSYADSGWYRGTMDSNGPISQYELTEIDLTSQETTYLDDIFLRPYSAPEPTTSIGAEDSF